MLAAYLQAEIQQHVRNLEMSANRIVLNHTVVQLVKQVAVVQSVQWNPCANSIKSLPSRQDFPSLGVVIPKGATKYFLGGHGFSLYI